MKARSLRGVWARALLVVLGAGVGAGLALGRVRLTGDQRWLGASTPAQRPVAAAAVEHGAAAEARAELDEADRSCLARRAALAQLPELLLPPLDRPELRAQLLGRTKNVPLFFLSRPEPSTDDGVATALREALEATPGYQTFGAVVGKVRKSPELAQAVFLREGYLYTESPELAALYGALTLSLLFRDPELQIVRGSEELSARRLEDGDYEYTSGAERGHRAKLLLFDRIAKAGTALSAARHVDLRALSTQLGFDELSVTRATASQLSVEAVYGERRVPSLLNIGQGEASLGCEAPGAAREEVASRRAVAGRAARAQTRLVSVIKEQIDEGLPFDEPKTEDGQQDGKLRPEWRTAYLKGSSSFEFNGDKYAVFDDSGRPRPPQVCIDFVLDTFERAGGSWWRPRGERRERAPGRLQFDDSVMENRRSVERFIDFARAHGEAFEVYEPPPEARVPFRNRTQFFAALYAARAQFRQGDIVAILGPRDDEKLHYHSFIIVGSDPLSGLPTELAANAGRPRIRSWEGELSNAPRRSIFARVRPKQVWLDSFLGGEAGVSADDPSPASADAAKRPAAG
ncbi:MAG TPA: hypothetical protein VEQ58_02370 [Polyangiaceae bacterium]|nr:hypothetical protein [Polyangiaceae bacterium]